MKGSDYLIILILIIGLGGLGFLFSQQDKSVEEIFAEISGKFIGSSSDSTNSALEPENKTNQQNPTNTYTPPVTNPSTTTATNSSATINPSETSNPTTPPPIIPNWTEERFGWYYPPGWGGYSKGNIGDSFGIYNPSAGTDTEIQVGGLPGTKFQSGCEQSQVDDFQHGVSVEACVNGTIVYLSNVSASWTPSQEEKNIFGDFVLRNR